MAILTRKHVHICARVIACLFQNIKNLISCQLKIALNLFKGQSHMIDLDDV